MSEVKLGAPKRNVGGYTGRTQWTQPQQMLQEKLQFKSNWNKVYGGQKMTQVLTNT